MSNQDEEPSSTSGIWNEEILQEKDETVTLKYIPFKIKIYKTTKQDGGIRVPLDDNNPLCDQFR